MTLPRESDTLSIGDAARRAGVGIDTLRSWTKRYGLPVTFSSGGSRRFSASMVEHLRAALMRGHSGPAAVAEVKSAAAVITCCPRCGEPIDRVAVRFGRSSTGGPADPNPPTEGK